MEKQSEISSAKLESMVGGVFPVLIDGPSTEHEWVIGGRLETQAPEVDGQVYLDAPPEDIAPGQIRKVRIDRTSDYDLVGTVIA